MSPISKVVTGRLNGVKEKEKKKKGLHSFTLLAEFAVRVVKRESNIFSGVMGMPVLTRAFQPLK